MVSVVSGNPNQISLILVLLVNNNFSNSLFSNNILKLLSKSMNFTLGFKLNIFSCLYVDPHRKQTLYS